MTAPKPRQRARKLKPPAGFLEVGINRKGQVVINHPKLTADENGVGHIVFSVQQAVGLAVTLLRKASEAQDRRKP